MQREIGDNGGEDKGRQGEKLEKVARSTVESGGGDSGSPLIEVVKQMKHWSNAAGIKCIVPDVPDCKRQLLK